MDLFTASMAKKRTALMQSESTWEADVVVTFLTAEEWREEPSLPATAMATAAKQATPAIEVELLAVSRGGSWVAPAIGCGAPLRVGVLETVGLKKAVNVVKAATLRIATPKRWLCGLRWPLPCARPGILMNTVSSNANPGKGFEP